MRIRRLRVLALSLPLLGLSFLVPHAGATAPVGASVSVANMAFTPATVKVTQGKSVAWTFHAVHTTTSDQGFWDSGNQNPGMVYTHTFTDAGTYRYHCSIHPDMLGAVQVPLRASGASSKGWRITWSSASTTPASHRFDFSYRRVGTSTWIKSRVRTASRSTVFNPARSASYQVRARSYLGSAVSGWSPVMTIKIT